MEVTTNKKTIASGIYLVIDPSMDEQTLLDKLKLVLTKKIAGVQVWDNFKKETNKEILIQKIHEQCKEQQVPLLINNHWEFVASLKLEGVHFDKIPKDINAIKKKINRDFIIGLTCENDLEHVKWAKTNNVDYISFCSMFPSKSAENCEIVQFETVQKASEIFKNPLFLAGGINPDNSLQLNVLEYNGIAVISGIMDAERPDLAIDKYYENLKLKT